MLLQRFFLIGLVLTIPSLGMEWLNLVRAEDESLRLAEQDAQRALAQIISEQGNATKIARELLESASLGAWAAARDPVACAALQESRRTLAYVKKLRVTDANGVVRCTGPDDKDALGTSEAAVPEVGDAIRRGGFRLGSLQVGPFSVRFGLAMATSWTGPDGRRGGAVTGLMDFDNSVRIYREPDDPREWVPAVFMADLSGRVAFAVPPMARASTAPDFVMSAISAGNTSGVEEGPWLDGRPRVVAYAVSSAMPGSEMVVGVGYDRAAILGAARRAARESFFELAIAGAVSLGGVLLIGFYRVDRPMRRLQDAVKRWHDGDRSARARLGGNSEMANLGRLVDAMAENVARQGDLARRSGSLVGAMFDSMSDVVYVEGVPGKSGGDGRPLLANLALRELFGIPADAELDDIDVLRGLGPAGSEQARKEIARVSADGEACPRVDHVVVAKDGTHRSYEMVYFPLRGGDGKVWAVGLIGRDTTQYTEAQDALKRAKDAAEEADRTKTRFLAAAAHDLRQPLQGAMMFARLAADRIGDPAACAEALGRSRASLGEMGKLLETLLDVSRLDAASARPERRPVRLTELIGMAVASFEEAAAAKGLHIESSAPDVMVLTDPSMLGRVLRNLIENAVRYTQEGGVAVECARLPGRVQVRVVDTGVGIPRPDLERIWQEFEQLGNLQRDRAQGLGLGLPIVKRLASMLGLVVTVTSTPGLGSTFSIEVPLAPACIDNGGNACSGSAAPREGMTVLVVEDDETILEGLKAVLGGAGYAVTATQRADAAIGEVVRGMRPDLVVADYRLGEGGSGTDAIVGVRRTMGCDVPALLVTGELLGEPQTDANNYGFDLLHKPVDPDRLLDRMAELLS